jgi:hypothetical protein
VLILGGGGGCLMPKKMDNKEGYMEGGYEGRLSSHKLNIIDEMTNRIILSVQISCHHMICLF